MTTLLLACGALAREVIAIRDRHGWDAKILALPVLLHNSPRQIPDAVARSVREHGSTFAKVVIVYGDCGTGGLLDKELEHLGLERVAGPHCYEMYAGAADFAALHDDEPGTFYLTDYLAGSFDHLVIEGLGLDRYPELRGEYFAHYERVIYLQQRVEPELIEKARLAAAALDLPLEIRPTGYGELESRLTELMEKEGVYER